VSDYERYLRTDELLALQKAPEEMAHRDELLFQTVHQSSELWLKHASFETETAARWIRAGDLAGAAGLLRRAGLGLRLLISQLEMLEQMSPWEYRLIRRTLDSGSGFDSPGFIGIQRSAKEVGQAFSELLLARGVSLVDIHRQPREHADAYEIAELLIDWDERLSLWRLHHLKVVERNIGREATGTQGHPVSLLRDLTLQRCFPELWEVRDQLTQLARREHPGGGSGGERR
jgi:tryptophan 2,3-dioxygenase